MERCGKITLAGREYGLVLTTRATKEIAKRYGGLSNLGDSLMKSENFESALDEVIWLIVLLANQGVQIHNLLHTDDRRELLTNEMVELLTSPLDLAEYKDAIMNTLVAGTKREVQSEERPEKNVDAAV